MIRSYFVKRNLNVLLFHTMDTSVDKSTRIKITNTIVDFMVETFGLENISREDKKKFAQATIALFPFLQYRGSQNCGIDLLVEEGGYFSNRLKTLKNALKKSIKPKIGDENNNEKDDVEKESEESSPESES